MNCSIISVRANKIKNRHAVFVCLEGTIKQQNIQALFVLAKTEGANKNQVFNTMLVIRTISSYIVLKLANRARPN